VFKAFVVGLLVGVLLLAGGVYYYFVSGMAPVAAGDPPLPYEKRMASRSLDAHIEESESSAAADSGQRGKICWPARRL